MPKRRDLVKMSDEDLWKFIETQKTVQVATIGRDGMPHVMPLWFAIDGGDIILETFTKSQKIKNLERDNRISILFEDGQTYDQLRGVSIQATAELIRDHDLVHKHHLAVLVRNQPGVPEEALATATASMVPKKTVIRITPRKIMSWDHTKLDGIY
jgi:PPOX class probable F420-dependent enzyme